METKFPTLLSPLVIGKYVVKNRMESANAIPHFLQSAETYPAPDTITYYEDLAKSGAAIVTVSPYFGKKEIQRKAPLGDVCRYPVFDRDDPSVENYMSQIAEIIKFYGAMPCIGVRPDEPPGYNVVGGKVAWDQHEEAEEGKEISEAQIEVMVEDIRDRVRYLHRNGFQMASIPLAYGCCMASRFMNRNLNTRTDKFGGSLENRCRMAVMECRAVKETCPDVLLEIIVSGVMPGMSQEETIEFVKMVEPYVDVVQIRADTCMNSHPTGFNSSRENYLVIPYARAMKDAGIQAKIEVVGGFHNPEHMERFLAEGTCDLISMGRSWICDPEYGKKIFSGNTEDIIPCVRCNKCHVQNETGPWLNVCSVNPIHGLRARISHMVDPSGLKKRVAVIGGGPAGMMAALTAVKQGHTVDLYEKKDHLGGQLCHADYSSFKWPLKDYKEWLIHQCEKNGVQIHLNTVIAPEALKAMGYDVVFAALGVQPNRLPIPGIDGENVTFALDVYGRQEQLGQNVVVIGGAETGTETALYLSECGHTVTVLSRQSEIAPDCDRIHYREVVLDACAEAKNFRFILNAATKEIRPDGVVYADKDGVRHTVPADSVVVSGGSLPLQAEALRYSDCAPEFKLLGDCNIPSNMQAALRSGFAAASLI